MRTDLASDFPCPEPGQVGVVEVVGGPRLGLGQVRVEVEARDVVEQQLPHRHREVVVTVNKRRDGLCETNQEFYIRMTSAN